MGVCLTQDKLGRVPDGGTRPSANANSSGILCVTLGVCKPQEKTKNNEDIHKFWM